MNKTQNIKKGTAAKVLIIYTGGTLGMVYDEITKNLVPFAFSQIVENVPELDRLKQEIDYVAFEQPIDSANIRPEDWTKLVQIIEANYDAYAGFVILHGTDTMSYTASALSFMIQNLKKPIILTGAQLPIGIPRTDAKENLITAIEIAGNETVALPEVCIYFNGRLLRGNRSKKRESSQFDAFDSENLLYLAEIGVSMDYNMDLILKYNENLPTLFYENTNSNIAVIRIYPGLKMNNYAHFFTNTSLAGIIIESYGAGNAPSDPDFLQFLNTAIQRQILVLNISQCTGGQVDMDKYETGHELKKIGVTSGQDMTIEAAICKLMWVCGTDFSYGERIGMLATNIAGEMDILGK